MLRRIAKAVLIAFALVVVAPLAFCVALPIGLTEIQARQWARVYSEAPHPAGTERLAQQFGTVKESNGDSCDFEYLEARSYRAEDRTAIETFYAGQERLAPGLNRLHPKFDDNANNYEGKRSNSVDQNFAADLRSLPKDTYYTLWGYGQPGADIRCI
jgi:hypothetical protein